MLQHVHCLCIRSPIPRKLFCVTSKLPDEAHSFIHSWRVESELCSDSEDLIPTLCGSYKRKGCGECIDGYESVNWSVISQIPAY